MKKLALSPLAQTKDNDCLPICLQMVLNYYGIQQDYAEMLEKFDFYSMGLSFPQAGTFMQSKNLQCTIDSLNPHLFNAKDIGKTQQALRDKIANAKFEKEEFNNVRDYFLDFMDAGGIVNPCVPTKQTLIDEIDAGRPVILPLVTRVLHGHKEGYNFHANLLYGYDDKNFYVYDPGEPEFGGGHHVVDQDLLLYAMHITGYADIDNASILKIAQ